MGDIMKKITVKSFMAAYVLVFLSLIFLTSTIHAQESEKERRNSAEDYMSPESVYHESGNWGENLTWELRDGVLTISGTGETPDYSWDTWLDSDYPDFMSDNELPWEMGDITEEITEVIIEPGVTGIGDGSFYHCGMTNLTLPDTVTHIDAWAFCECASLTAISGIGSVKEIGQGAFDGCRNLINIDLSGVHYIDEGAFRGCGLTDVVIPYGMKSISYETFAYCPRLTEVILPDSVKKIGRGAFTFCGLKTITLPETLETIGSQAFSYCRDLTEVIIPDSVLAMSSDAFSDCDNLKAVHISDKNKCYSVYEGAVLNKDKTELIFCPAGISGEYSVPESVISAEAGAFSGCSKLERIVIPEGLQEISREMFDGCSGLRSITIPAGVQEIGCWAFCGCSSLTQIYFAGDRPDFAVEDDVDGGSVDEIFNGVTATAYYPGDNPTWETPPDGNFRGGNITWVPLDDAGA